MVVIGGNGRVGRRVVARLAGDPERHPVVVDRALRGFRSDLETHRLDVGDDDLGPVFDGADVVVFAAEDPVKRGDLSAARRPAAAVLDAAAVAGVGHLVHVSSALVYGAHRDNPVPLTEAAPLRPVLALGPAVVKAELDRDFSAARTARRAVTVLRPTTTLAPGRDGWLANGLRRAMTVREDSVDPPVQFLHVDDLVAAIIISIEQRLDGAFNVAPDGWIGPERFRTLAGGVRVRAGRRAVGAASAARNRVGTPVPEGLDAHVRHAWVVANDRLRAAGWEPGHSNEEAFVAGTTAPPWAAVSPKRRQELALGLSGAAVAAAGAAATAAARRLVR